MTYERKRAPKPDVPLAVSSRHYVTGTLDRTLCGLPPAHVLTAGTLSQVSCPKCRDIGKRMEEDRKKAENNG